MDNRRTIDDIFDGFIPVKDRKWYPWVWPSTEWFKKTEIDNPNEVSRFMAKVKDLADTDFFFFCNEIMRAPQSTPLDEDLHGEICWLLQQRDDVVIIIPRGHLKSTIGNVYYSIWRLAHDPILRIKVASENIDVAEGFLRDVKRQILDNPKLRTIYPQLRPASGIGNRNELWAKHEINVQRPASDKRGPSIMIMSAGQTQTGTHCDEAIYDDIMTPRNANKSESRATIKQWYHDTQPLIDPGNKKRQVLYGTPYHFDDIYAMLEKTGIIPIYKRSAVENGKYIWNDPGVIRNIKEMKESLPAQTYSSQYMCEIINEEQSEFKPDWVRYWCTTFLLHGDFYDNPPQNVDEALDKWYKMLDIYLGMDANRTVKKRSDKTSILTLGVDNRGRKFILDRVSRTMNTPNIRDTFCMMFHQWEKYNIVRAGIETIGGDNHVYMIIREKLMDMGLPFHKVKPFHTERGVPKEDRIRSMQSDFYHHNVYIRDDMDDLVTQLLQFPYGAHDDDIDVLSYMLAQLVKPKTQKVQHDTRTGWKPRRNKYMQSGSWMSAG